MPIGCSSSSDTKACPKAVDALDANIIAATNTTDISAAVVKASFDACGGPYTWRHSADVDKIGDKIGSLHDNDGTPLSTDTALDFLCARFDQTNSTSTCKGR